MNHEGTKDTKEGDIGKALIRIAIRSTLILCVIASVSLATIVIRFCWLNSAHHAIMEEQLDLLEQIDPEVGAHNVWGNAVISTYLPMNDSPKPLSDMRKLTNSLREIVSTPKLNDQQKRRLAYELLLRDSTNKRFVEQHASCFEFTAEK